MPGESRNKEGLENYEFIMLLGAFGLKILLDFGFKLFLYKDPLTAKKMCRM